MSWLMRLLYGKNYSAEPEPEPENNNGAFSAIAAQATVNELTHINDKIALLDKFITDLQFFRCGEHEGNIFLSYYDNAGKECVIDFWCNGDFEGETAARDILTLVTRERARQSDRMLKLMGRSPAKKNCD